MTAVSVEAALVAQAGVAASAGFWEQHGGAMLTLVGALVGALFGSLTTWLTSRSAREDARLDARRELVRKENFEALELAHAMKLAFSEMGLHVSGREEPGPDATPEQRAAAHESDQAAAAAIERLYAAESALELQTLRLGSIGADSTREQFAVLSAQVSECLVRWAERGDGRFIGAEFMAASAQLDQNLELAVEALRSELGVK